MTKPHELPICGKLANATKEPSLGELIKAVRSFENADTEYRRAKNTGEQPRLNRAGTRYYCAKHQMFRALRANTPEHNKEDGR